MQHYRDNESYTLFDLRGKHVVTIGGGTGPFNVLSSLKRYPCLITAVVSMADSGGSSRRLMDEFGQLPLGDLRQALVALSRKGALWRDVFTFRFGKGNGHRVVQSNGETIEMLLDTRKVAEQAGVSGHSLGNLILAALQDVNKGNLLHAIQDTQEILDTAGNVLPVTLSRVTLCAELENGETLSGETDIDTRGKQRLETHELAPLSPIKRVYLAHEAAACDDAIRAIRRADTIIIGPGDLYTSILPNLLIDGVADAIRASDAQKVYVCNLMTKHGETDGYPASRFVETIHSYLGNRVDRVILHDGSFPEHLLERYATEEQHPVRADVEEVRRLVPEVIVDQLLSVYQDSLVRHDADRLVRAIFTPPDVFVM
ncbi:MAG: gluconeogenesis factor YvcK family protein [Ktedonobacterales bacterium]